jgi:diaminopimelate epimerase
VTRTPSLPFAKYQGAGNDFVLIDGRPGAAAAQGDSGWATLARALCDRHFGVGADGLLVAAAPDSREAPGAAERMRMFNPDGSEAEMCGNGLRCFVRWLDDQGHVDGRGRRETARAFGVQTGAGVLAVEIDAGGGISVDMGAPRLAPAEIPLAPAVAVDLPAVGPVLHLPLPVEWPGGVAAAARVPAPLDVACVSMGNPHAILFVDEARAVALETLGPLVEHHPVFPARTNFELCEIVARDRIRVRVWERGAGITLACGTGACAAAVAARLRGYVDERVTVELPGGALRVDWPSPAGPGGALDASHGVRLSGPAVHVYDGTWRAPTALV